MPDVVVELQEALRSELKDPMGRLYTDADALLADAGAPIVAVGDVVTYHLVQAGHVPDVALVDERTERSQVDDEVRRGITGFAREVSIDNPPATLTADLLAALASAIDDATAGAPTGDAGETLLQVEGEEDLAALPAIVAAPEGSSVVYGQPGEGMVLVDVDEATTDRARELLSRMEGDTERLWSTLDVPAHR